MKLLKHIFSILFIFTCFNCFSQEKWEPSTCRYTNQNIGFHWNLLPELEWVKVQGNERNTIFAAESPYGLFAFVNVHDISNDIKNKNTIAPYFDNYKTLIIDGANKAAELYGGSCITMQCKLVRFFGTDAIFSLQKFSISDDVVNEISYGATYMFYYVGKLFKVNIKCSSEVYNEIGLEGIKTLFTNCGPNYSRDRK